MITCRFLFNFVLCVITEWRNLYGEKFILSDMKQKIIWITHKLRAVLVHNYGDNAILYSILLMLSNYWQDIFIRWDKKKWNVLNNLNDIDITN